MSRRRYSFVAGAGVGAVAAAVLLLGLPGVQAGGGAPVVTVRASDYAYRGVPGTVKAGETRFAFVNESGAEAHEMSLFRINDGVTESFDQILAEDEARARESQPAPDQPGPQPSGQPGAENRPADEGPPPPRMTFFGGTGAGPGESSRMDLIGDLPAGRYGIVCFIPSADEAGTPHYKKGMKAEFTVR